MRDDNANSAGFPATMTRLRRIGRVPRNLLIKSTSRIHQARTDAPRPRICQFARDRVQNRAEEQTVGQADVHKQRRVRLVDRRIDHLDDADGGRRGGQGLQADCLEGVVWVERDNPDSLVFAPNSLRDEYSVNQDR